MRTHIQILAWIYLILGGACLFAAVSVMLALQGAPGFEIHFQGFQGDFGPGARLATATLSAGLCSAIGVLAGFAGWGLLKRRQWGRILAIVVSVLYLPLGYALLLGIYGLIVLLWPGAAREFS